LSIKAGANSMSVPDPLARHMPIVARLLWGEPNPVHSAPGKPRWGNKGSLSVDETKGIWFNHETGQGGGVLEPSKLEKERSGGEAFKYLNSIGCDVELQFKPNLNGATNGAKRSASNDAKKVIVATYDYCDEGGAQLFQVVRMEFRKPDGTFVLGK